MMIKLLMLIVYNELHEAFIENDLTHQLDLQRNNIVFFNRIVKLTQDDSILRELTLLRENNESLKSTQVILFKI